MGSEFSDLKIWKLAHNLTLQVYEVTTNFPKEEVYGLIAQIRRAAVSVELNLAEGEGSYHQKESINFFLKARSSACEVRAALLISKDLDYLPKNTYQKFEEDYLSLIKQMNNLIKYRRDKVK